MASTTLFAPQVRAIQPAFPYPSDNSEAIKIYFTLSDYNTIDQVKSILYTIVDPNQKSTWGSNSMFNSGRTYVKGVSISNISTDTKTGEYYFTINDLSSNNNFKTFTKNQFYQVQLYLTNLSSLTGDISEQDLNNNQDDISLPSQVSLIRPISPLKSNAPTITNDISHNYLEGFIEYADDTSIETIDTCNCKIYLNTSNDPLESVSLKNNLGLRFKIPFKTALQEGKIYKYDYELVTKYGYVIKGTGKYQVPSYTDSATNLRVGKDSAAAALKVSSTRSGTLWRWSNTYQAWQIIKENYLANEVYYDYNIESEESYKYRVTSGSNSYSTGYTQYSVDYEDIYLSDENTMLCIKYNPKVTNLKYVTQEAVTNTIGGKYPVIRRNGDTYYRQFSISGLLYLNASEYTAASSTDSRLTDMGSWFDDESSGLYLKDTSGLVSHTTKARLERQAREIAVAFLTNGGKKLFRSPTEGNMIIYLSAVSFTPNIQLGRSVYDFSATVTEVCDYNFENLQKYNLHNGTIFNNALLTCETPTRQPVTIVE